MSKTKTAKPKPERDPIPVFDEDPGADRPTFYVVGEEFHAVTSDGLLVVPMRFKTSVFKQVLRAEGDNLELFLILIDGIGDEDTIAQIDELDIFESVAIAMAYFQAWREKQQASVGEAQRSSN
ncbi:hypothetical protein [Microbacterium sp. 2FI]|uniref:hypothetical protein n=1 Tax=Microbacterium sp. 2FI TaxID=2502193 RepID=UPI0010F4706E|nr:hypothetical protein [Microbacterium sp. 2FI]